MININSRTKILFSATFIMFAMPQISAANVSCTGQVSFVGIDQTGSVYAATGTGINAICNTVTQGSFTINTTACKMAYASLLSNEIAGRPVDVFYNDPNLTSCSQIAAWSIQPSAYFVES